MGSLTWGFPDEYYTNSAACRESVRRDVLRLQRLPAEDVTVVAYNPEGLWVYRATGGRLHTFRRGEVAGELLKGFEKEAEEGLKKKW